MADKAFKTRGKRCDVHGLLFDPELTSGCARCRKGGDPHAQPPKFLSLLLTLLGLTLVGGYVISGAIQRFRADARADPAVATAGTSIDDGVSAPTVLDPSAFEPRIRSLEAVLFDANETDFAVAADRIVGEAKSLESELRRASAAAPIVASVANFAVATRDATPSGPALQNARDRWVGLRQSIFRPAPWMAQGTVSTNTGGLGVRAHMQAADDIASVLMAAVQGVAPSGLGAEVDSLQAAMPPPPPLDADPRLLSARQTLDQLLGEFAALATQPASDAQRTALEALAQRVSTIRATLEDLVE